jgi:hypothetical protein
MFSSGGFFRLRDANTLKDLAAVTPRAAASQSQAHESEISDRSSCGRPARPALSIGGAIGEAIGDPTGDPTERDHLRFWFVTKLNYEHCESDR